MPSSQKIVSKATAGVIPRPRLLFKLQKQFSRRHLILISAPAGYGKSTLLSQFLQHQLMPYVWHCVTSGDRDPGYMLDAVASKMLRNLPKLKEKHPLLLDKLHSTTSGYAKCDHIFNALAVLNKTTLYLILDETHKAEGSETFKDVLEFLVQRAPENLGSSGRCRDKLKFPDS